MAKVLKTGSLIDSIDRVINYLNQDDVKNVTAVKNILVDSGLGDTLSFYLNNSFQLAIDFSINKEKKETIDSIKENIFYPMEKDKSWQDELFGMTNPLGASLILIGLKKELYKASIIAFKQ